MTLTPYITLRGKAIHILSLDDLIDSIESGERLRAYCPIHGSDHQRSLSIDRASGWGFCHCCHATVLVEAMSPLLVVRPGKRDEHHGAAGGTHVAREHAEPHLAASSPPRVAPRVCPAPALPEWQREELAALKAVVPLMHEALASSQRAQRYLDERGIPLPIASGSDVGYLSRSMWEQIPVSAEQHCLKRWIGRMLFPLHSPFGQGFIGRTLPRDAQRDCCKKAFVCESASQVISVLFLSRLSLSWKFHFSADNTNATKKGLEALHLIDTSRCTFRGSCNTKTVRWFCLLPSSCYLARGEVILLMPDVSAAHVMIV